MSCFLFSFPRLMSSLGMAPCRNSLLGFYSFSSSIFGPPWHINIHLYCLSFIMSVGLLAHWALPLSSSLLCFYLLLCLWTCLLPFPSMLTHWAFVSFLGLSWPLFLTSTSYYSRRPASLLGFYLFLWALMAHLLLFCFSNLFLLHFHLLLNFSAIRFFLLKTSINKFILQ